MSKEEKKQKVYITTPPGIAVYPWLNRPDTKFDATKGGSYHVKLRMPIESLAKTMEQLDALAEQAFNDAKETIKSEKKNKWAEKLKKLSRFVPYSIILDDDGNETDQVEIGAKMHAIVSIPNKDPFTQKPTIFDAAGKELTKAPAIYGGSTLKFNAVVTTFHNAATDQAGVSLRLRAVQIIKLVSGGGATAANCGFGVEEGGFVGEEDAPQFGDSSEATDVPANEAGTDATNF